MVCGLHPSLQRVGANALTLFSYHPFQSGQRGEIKIKSVVIQLVILVAVVLFVAMAVVATRGITGDTPPGPAPAQNPPERSGYPYRGPPFNPGQ